MFRLKELTIRGWDPYDDQKPLAISDCADNVNVVVTNNSDKKELLSLILGQRSVRGWDRLPQKLLFSANCEFDGKLLELHRHGEQLVTLGGDPDLELLLSPKADAPMEYCISFNDLLRAASADLGDGLRNIFFKERTIFSALGISRDNWMNKMLLEGGSAIQQEIVKCRTYLHALKIWLSARISLQTLPFRPGKYGDFIKDDEKLLTALQERKNKLKGLLQQIMHDLSMKQTKMDSLQLCATIRPEDAEEADLLTSLLDEAEKEAFRADEELRQCSHLITCWKKEQTAILDQEIFNYDKVSPRTVDMLISRVTEQISSLHEIRRSLQRVTAALDDKNRAVSITLENIDKFLHRVSPTRHYVSTRGLGKLIKQFLASRQECEGLNRKAVSVHALLDEQEHKLANFYASRGVSAAEFYPAWNQWNEFQKENARVDDLYTKSNAHRDELLEMARHSPHVACWWDDVNRMEAADDATWIERIQANEDKLQFLQNYIKTCNESKDADQLHRMSCLAKIMAGFDRLEFSCGRLEIFLAGSENTPIALDDLSLQIKTKLLLAAHLAKIEAAEKSDVRFPILLEQPLVSHAVNHASLIASILELLSKEIERQFFFLTSNKLEAVRLGDTMGAKVHLLDDCDTTTATSSADP